MGRLHINSVEQLQTLPKTQSEIDISPFLKTHKPSIICSIARRKTTSKGWTIMMFTLRAGINCFIILKLYFFFGITLISFDKCEHLCKWTARMVPLGTPTVVILYILPSRTRFRSWSCYRYRKRFGDLDHCSPPLISKKTHDRWNRENKEFRIY